MRIEVNGRRNAGLAVSEVSVLTKGPAVAPLSDPPSLALNIAAGSPYLATGNAIGKYPDSGKRELTDGRLGAAFERDSAWSAWKGRVEIEIALPRPEAIATADVGALGGDKWGVSFPNDVEVYALAEGGPDGLWLRLGRAAGGTVPAAFAGRFATRRYRLGFPPVTATRVRVVASGPMVFLDEVLLGAADTQASPASAGVAATLCEMEDLVPRKAVEDADAVAGRAIRFGPGDTVRLPLPLRDGDYVLRLRARPTEPDVYSAVELRLGPQPVEPLHVTIPGYTRHRRYVRVTPGAAAVLELQHAEGPALILDRLRVEPAFENASIRGLKPPCLETSLTRRGRPAARIVIPANGQFRRQAQVLVQAVHERTGATLPIVDDASVLRGDYAQHAHVVLGTYLNNSQVWPLAPNSWGRAPLPPPGEFALQTYHNPMGLGRNGLALLAQDDEGMDRAVAQLVSRLDTGPDLSLPPITVPEPAPLTDGRRREIIVDSGRWIRQHMRSFLTRWKRFGPGGFRFLAYRFFEWEDSRDALQTDLYHSGFADAELQKLIRCWDGWEEHPCFTDLERLAITNSLLEVAHFCHFPYQKYLWGVRNRMGADELLAFARGQPAALRWNHQTFPAYSLLTAAQYFGTYYQLPEASAWEELARLCFEPMRNATKPGEDCWGYQDITMVHALRYFTAIRDDSYLDSGVTEAFLRLRLVSMDNSGSGVNHGDSSPYQPPLAPGWETRNDTIASFLSTYWRPDPAKIDFASTFGVYVHPLDGLFSQHFGAPPDGRLFDKICFRTAVDVDRHYLLLDGVSRSHHGHWDGNSILRFFDNGRCFLVEGDYLNGDMKDHNTLTFSRNAEFAHPPLFSHIDGVLDTAGWALTRTVSPEYNGARWTRNIVWSKDRYFVVLDELVAEEPGIYDTQVRWRTLGTVRQEGPHIAVEQAGGQTFHLVNADAARTIVRNDPADGAKNWRRYPHAEPVTRLISHRVVSDLPREGRQTVRNLFHVRGPGETYEHGLLAVDGQTALVTGSTPALVGTGRLKAGGITLDAGLYSLSASRLAAVACVEAVLPGLPRTAANTRTLALDLGTREARNTVQEETHLTKLSVAQTERLRASLRDVLAEARAKARPSTPDAPPSLRQAGVSQVWTHASTTPFTAVHVADMDGDGEPEILAGTEDGRCIALSASGALLWQCDVGSTVNCIASGDSAGDRKRELALACNGGRLVLLDHQGEELRCRTFEPGKTGKGHVLVAAFGDFDGDRKDEIAVGLDSSQQVVIEPDGTEIARFGARHSTTVLAVADVDGNACDDLAIGCTYTERMMATFQLGGGHDRRAIGGAISGTSSVAFADVDGDGRQETIFAGKDASLRACRPGSDKYRLEPVWEKYLGTDALSRVVAVQPAGEGELRLVVGSMDGFAAGLDATGTVTWVRYLGRSVRDLDADGAARHTWVAVDQTVACLGATGDVLGGRRLDAEASHVLALPRQRCIAITGATLSCLALDRK